MMLIYLGLLAIYIIEFYSGTYLLSKADYSIYVFVIMSLIFIVKRRRQTILCPEILMLPTFFIITFYKELILDNLYIYSSLYDQFTDQQYLRAMSVNMIAFISFLIGGHIVSLPNKPQVDIRVLIRRSFNNSLIEKCYLIISLFLIIYSFITGKTSAIQKYQGGGGENTYLVFIIIALFICTIIEFIRLQKTDNSNIISVFKETNKLYLMLTGGFGLLLLVFGNRGEALLVFLPILFTYSYLIKQITNKQFGILILIGLPVMVVLAYTRVGNSFVLNDYNFLETFSDFGPAFLTQTGLIHYTDIHGCLGLGLGFRSLLSSIPFLGGVIQQIFPSSFSYEDNSAVLATQNFQLRNNLESGLGTSLIGDLYYSGGVIWVVIFMFILGYFMSLCYKKINSQKSIDIYSFMAYIWLCSNSIYMMRSEWYSMFRYIGFSFIIIIILRFINSNLKNRTRFIR